MKKNFLFVVMVAALAMMFTSCSKDDGSEEPASGKTGVGVHRVDVHFEGNIAECNSLNIFFALQENGTYREVYENGQKLSLDETTHTWYSQQIRDFSIYTPDGCSAVCASINMTTKTMQPLSSDVTVTLVGYVNDKRIKTQVATFPAGHTGMTVVMATDDTVTHPEVVQ